jgi:DinB superfamily
MPITPDDKNWTWVLERPCPECGFVAADVGRDDVARSIRDNAAAWPDVLARSDVSSRPDDDTWSPLEYACHVRDVYRIFDGRLDRMLAEPAPTFANWDQDVTAVEDAYGQQDPGTVAVELADAAARIADRFDGVTGDQWTRFGNRSDGARFTVESLARYLIHDPVHHLVDVGVTTT